MVQKLFPCFKKKLLEVWKAHLYKNYYTFSLLPVERSEGLDPINGKINFSPRRNLVVTAFYHPTVSETEAATVLVI